MSKRVQLSANGLGVGLSRVGNSVKSTSPSSVIWGRTKNITTVAPSCGGILGDWDAGDGQFYTGVSSISNTYTTPSTEHLIQLSNIDPLDITSIVWRNIGLTDLSSISAAVNATLVYIYGNSLSKAIDFSKNKEITNLRYNTNSIPSVAGQRELTKLITLHAQINGLQGEFEVPQTSTLATLWAYTNLGITSVSSVAGCTGLLDARFDGCSLTLSSVDTLITEVASNGAATVLNISGGASATPSAGVISTQIPIITGNGGSVNYNP